ncbi:dihydrofolate reductase family protein [Streptomyces sp. SID3343]|uniref:dihydrofolate reductase family protein n=1 Tax=Streptomyces sp. SID3343 TaxID=2690260 RepID=UPI00136EF514|nr:dihydrofolate reductase family protein [Streptomyces sp. SID3343]MYW01569.1 dihydrofolate reductase [Streptomyces sp. SID3343]
MRKLTYFIASTLDGFIADRDGNFDFFPIADATVEYLVREYPETLPTHVASHFGVAPDAEYRHFDTVLMGRATYEPALKAGITNPYRHLRTYVVTSSITESPDPAVTLVAGDPLAAVRELKTEAGDKGIWVAGGAQLAGALLPEIDEVIVKTYPIMIGTGIPLMSGEFAVTAFTRTGGVVLDSGVSVTTYTRT